MGSSGTAASPLVAIPAFHLAAGRVADWSRGGYAVPAAYVAAVRRAGARPVLVPTLDIVDPEATLAPFDGLLLTGGGDIEPSRYGGEPHPQVYGVDPSRDAAELDLVHAALSAGIPTFVICRGMQVLNVALGGTLHQHLPDLQGMDLHGQPGHDLSVVHDVKVTEGTLLAQAAGRSVLRCTSHHHQAVDMLGDGLTAVAASGDGLVEAVELEDPGGRWVLGVQWHPEMTASEDPNQQALFSAHALACSGRRG
ncbi:MAG TPA: gamma-glutamyl-gamma-aminobutyrate hydrolase family protein [Acidimicrobiales bacterium]|nr:gamma-glutamyl-gamma-aminobutyrate hydrolase family protein [Acidimicrobiales bacterium]